MLFHVYLFVRDLLLHYEVDYKDYHLLLFLSARRYGYYVWEVEKNLIETAVARMGGRLLKQVVDSFDGQFIKFIRFIRYNLK